MSDKLFEMEKIIAKNFALIALIIIVGCIIGMLIPYMKEQKRKNRAKEQIIKERLCNRRIEITTNEYIDQLEKEVRKLRRENEQLKSDMELAKKIMTYLPAKSLKEKADEEKTEQSM